MNYKHLLAIILVLNGLTLLGFKLVDVYGLGSFTMEFLVALYLFGTMCSFLSLAGRRIEWDKRSVVVGIVSGISGLIGTWGSVKAVGALPAYIAYPIPGGAGILLVSLIGWLLFKERIGAYGVAGIVVGAVAIMCLSLG